MTRALPKFSWLYWSLLIILLSLMPSSGFPRHSLLDLISIDKWAHLLFYAVLTYLMMHTLSSESKSFRPQIRKVIISIVFGSIFGLLIEIFQGISPSRYFDYLDIIANIIGCITGVLFYNYLFNRTQKT